MRVFCGFLFAIIAVYCLFYVFLLFKTKKPFKNLMINAIIGVASLIFIYLIRKFTLFYIPINQWTVISSAVGGLPAVFGILLFRIML
jgi:hypothetical protein